MKQRKRIKINSLIALTVILCLLLSACSVFSRQSTTAGTKSSSTVLSTSQTTTAAQRKEEDSFDLTNYAHLSDGEKDIYDRLFKAIDAWQPYMEEDTEEFALKAVDKVYFYSLLADHPELFYARGNSNLYEETDTGKRVARFDLKYPAGYDSYLERYEQVKAICAQIEKSAGKKADDFAKAKAAYDYLIEHCAYDYDYSGNSLQETQTTASYADGALLDHKAVCSGYSRAFKLIMDYCGIECMCVSNSDHEWNVVKLEGNYYHIDVTWADTEQNTGERYFCVTDEEIYKDHEKPAFELPECVMVR